MKIEQLVANVTPVVFPDRAEFDILGIMFDVFWPNLAAFVVGEPLFDVGIPLESQLVANVTTVVCPDRAEFDILGIMFDVFWPNLAAFVGGEPPCNVGIPLEL